jgi:hypothetical protein
MLEILKWVASGMFLVATLMMFSQKLAAKSPWPWTLFLIGNLIWLVDCLKTHNMPWIPSSLVFCFLDAGLIIIRIRNINVKS